MSRRSSSNAPARMFVLDFDGVLCDSARETAVSAWRAGAAIWPEWRNREPPSAAVAAFVALRPLLETGYQAALLMRLAADGGQFSSLPGGFDRYCRTVMSETGLSRGELVALFGTARDRWIHEDPGGWLAAHRFYPGTVEAAARAAVRGELYVLTTKQERFARQLLDQAGIPLSSDRLLGFERGRPKEDELVDLVRRCGDTCRLHFVEDRVRTLARCLDRTDLEQVSLYLADWGYNTSEDVSRARDHEHIQVLRLAEFATMLDSPAMVESRPPEEPTH